MHTLLSALRLLGIVWATVWVTGAGLALWFGRTTFMPSLRFILVLALVGAPGVALAVLATWLRQRSGQRESRRGFDVLPR